MKYSIGDFVKNSGSRTLLIIATKEQELDSQYLKKHRLKIDVEWTENKLISVENGFDYRTIEVEHFENNGNIILDKQTNFSNYFENDLYR